LSTGPNLFARLPKPADEVAGPTTLTRVGKFLPEGLRALSSLLTILFRAAAACKVAATLSATWQGIGLTLEGGKYWIGVCYERPGTLGFTSWSRIDLEAARKLGVGEVVKENRAAGGYIWSRSAELESESIYFFSRSKVSQMEWVQGFLGECLTTALSIETLNQSPIPEEPEAI
jgi:hypothetical protein